MRIAHLLIAAGVLAWAGAAAAQPLALPPFHSIQLRDGGHVVLRQGPQSVSFLRGDRAVTRIGVEGGVLRIGGCRTDCPEGYRSEIEVVVPDVAMLSVADGGTIEARGGFDPQPSLSLAVREGGSIDARPLAAAAVSAAVTQGGRILVRPAHSLYANVAQGGSVTWWGSAAVRSDVQGGGRVARGKPADLARPLPELSPRAPAPPAPPTPPDMVPPVPSVPPLPPQ